MLGLQKKKKERYIESWYNLRPLLGNSNWALFYILIASRQTGKGFSVQDYCLSQWKKNPDNYLTWIRLREEHAKELLKNNAQKLFEPILVRRYGLNLRTRGTEVYHVEEEKYIDKNGNEQNRITKKIKIAEVYGASTYYKTKGQTLMDAEWFKDPTHFKNIVIDECVAEPGEPEFDRANALVNLLETMCRNQKDQIKIFMLGNNVIDANSSDVITSCFNFFPEEFGIYKLKNKRAVIHNVAPTLEYEQMRKGSIANLLLPNSSTFTNRRNEDKALIDKSPLRKPMYVIKFDLSSDTWFTVWNNNIIKRYNKEQVRVIPMRPYIGEVYTTEAVSDIMLQFDARSYHYRDLITFKLFQHQLKCVKPRGTKRS